jgi:9-cis-epoxycarotenoid dioxygenase
MIHDFAITKSYVIVPDLPIEFTKEKPFKDGGSIFFFNKNATARYGIFPRRCNDPTKIKWFNMKPHYSFHYSNAWEDKNEKG